MENQQYPFDRVSSTSKNVTIDCSIVMPVFNEAGIVELTVRDWNRHLLEMGLEYELIIINDGSSDGTGRVLDRLRREIPQIRVIHQLNTGHSQAIRRGYSLARGQYILQCDLNGRYEPEDFTHLWEAKGKHKLVLANRTHRLDSLPRRILSSGLRQMTSLICGVTLNDPNVPFRLCETETVQKFLPLLPLGWKSTNLAISISVARELPQMICEVKIPFRKRAMGKSSTSLYVLTNLAFEYFTELLTLRNLLKSTRKKLTFLSPAAI